jgi:3-isopropylmalate/(R)-2-methylmalate dehydratase small subunit
MRKFERVTSPVALLPLDNVNTDQIIPARFLTRTAVEGWGPCLFADWKKDPQFTLNDPLLTGTAILIAGANFGCGSSREHAAWALRDSGFRVIVAPSFADIFRENAIKNGLLPATIAPHHWFELTSQLRNANADVLTVDLASQSLTRGDAVIPFEIDSFAKTCLIQGLDELGYILEHEYAINAHEVFTSV